MQLNEKGPAVNGLTWQMKLPDMNGNGGEKNNKKKN